ncbi:MAG TPA: hypothetical protein VMF08_21240 [Candidatus Sulfotelmatobacter sp.]|nr:hypothetical protein [Candidatus Sulfotelmatobacter sp.]
MKIRPSIYIFCGLAILLIILIICFAKRPQAPLETQRPLLPKTNAPVVVNNPVPANIVPVIPHVVHPAVNPAEEKEQAEERQKTFEAEKNQPIIFYGKLEDQFGNPVVGAEIEGAPELSQGHTNVFTTSDDNGLFTLDAGTGWALGVMPRKQGYAVATANISFYYSLLEPSHITPDPNNPIVIKMWKLQGAQHLIHFNFETYISITGLPTSFDLKTGQQVQAGGDLTIKLISSPKPSVRNEYDWSALIQLPSGGILASSDPGLDEMFQAPDSGYQPEFDLNFRKGDQQWTPRFNSDFYFMGQNGGFYGKLWLEIDSDVVRNGTALATLKGYLNPAGSRNLEIDNRLVTEAHP